MTNLRKITLVLGLLTGPAVFTQASYADGGPVPLPPCWPCAQGLTQQFNVDWPEPLPLLPTIPSPAGVPQDYVDMLDPLPLPPCFPCSQGLTQHS